MNITDLTTSDLLMTSGLSTAFQQGFISLFSRFVLNFIVVMILARWLYYTSAKRKDFLFTYIMVSSIVFLLCYMLESVTLQLGFALGLFAIFGILRYRTDTIPIKEMTYLFVIIGISVINSLTAGNKDIGTVITANMLIIIITIALEKIWLLKNESSKLVLYEKINLIAPEHRKELIDDLQKRTGIKKINRIEIGKVNLLRDTCEITVFYDVLNPESGQAFDTFNSNDD